MSQNVIPKTGSRVLSFIIGLGAGVLLSILFAPMSDEDTRASLMNRADELKSQAAEAVENSENTVADKKDQLTATIDAGREGYKEEIAKATAAGTET